MERRRVLGLAAAGVLGGASLLHAEPSREPDDCSQSHTKWVVDAMMRMQKIKTGMTRKTLLTVFKEEGGISTRAW
jgi:hypothetical protein